MMFIFSKDVQKDVKGEGEGLGHILLTKIQQSVKFKPYLTFHHLAI